MNYLYIAAGLMAMVASIAHLTYGRRHYLQPLDDVRVASQVKDVLQFSFYSLLLMMMLSSIALLACGFDVVASRHSYALILFIVMNYGVLAIWQCYFWRVNRTEEQYIGEYYWLLFAMVASLSLMGLLL